MAAYTTFDLSSKVEIEDKDALDFWMKNFQENTTVSTQTFTEAMLKKFPDENKKVSGSCASTSSVVQAMQTKKDVSSREFDKFTWRFGPFAECVKNAQKVFFKEFSRVNGENEYTLVRWYHGFLEDSKGKILENPNKYLVREPKEIDRKHLLTVEYSKTFVQDGKKLLARNKKHLMINRKKNLFVWTTKDGKKQGHWDIEVALKEMTSGREPINSEMWNAVENQSLYQAASYDYDN
eukprot:CAMPEP_0114531314 /NCGR_PEP_ID=MMETSP0109-20121206/25991_1 /TAXON_ID=29199 /ORGANISM="Chlorarachnion reptans, Strain CCCM449" /LENGTH=235 /DNA_ID=CAMNT_0001714153 /DNA_START=146 /DNA_END=854 /DNA_ORIENTATION=+